MPIGVVSTQPDVYWKLWPGREPGLLADHAVARTSSTLPRPSVMIQWRVRSCAVLALSFEIVIV